MVPVHGACVLRFEVGLCHLTGRRTANVESTHGQLRARFTDGLGGNGAYGFTHVHQMSACKVAAVALCAHAAFGLAGQCGTNGHGAHARLLDLSCDFLVHDGIFGEENLQRIGGVSHFMQQGTAHNTLAQGQLDLIAFHERAHLDAVGCLAIVHGHNHVLHHVHQTAGEITGVCRLQGGVSQTFTRAVR